MAFISSSRADTLAHASSRADCYQQQEISQLNIESILTKMPNNKHMLSWLPKSYLRNYTSFKSDIQATSPKELNDLYSLLDA